MPTSYRTCRYALRALLLLVSSSACSKKADPATQLLNEFVESVAKNDRVAANKMFAPDLQARVLPDDPLWDFFVGGPAICLGDGLKAGKKLRPAENLEVDEQSFEKVMRITSPCGEATGEDGSRMVPGSTITIVRIDGRWFVSGLSQMEGVPL